ncbi:hypothetical protein M409DRAFT_24557 [Zasmidium cellare ATCC 36951]|uniref:rRNA biogenesis protein RRP5 n=1 Tax=Zasmidium cellare ATCC 36951 TaxID=1080233 RepID=A0A6A6CDN0_ZASCE|nr:uncharacterized protein M409DRAFT_24557 [Zasmidium cellare ATCC 36951]KAF2165171.1 hypothetical protein M409DRAFT_24557 [Zasmidium cellare ATCC 36951]
MAPLKRKAVTDERPSKKAKAVDVNEQDAPKEKKPPRKSQDGDRKEKKEKKSALSSILQQEESAFPRGGGGVLTALEQKQIQVQAERDALFEQEGGKADNEEDAGLFDEEAPAKKKQKKSRKNEEDVIKKIEGSGIRIQSLSYKNLAVGSSVLGRVTAVTSKDVALALPNNLTGYVPISAISERLTARIERVLADDAKPAAEDDGEDDQDIDLKQIVHTGQWLRGTVTAMGTETSGKSKKHIELSIDPSQVNGGLEQDNFVPNNTIQAAVRSVEDRGIVMDLGLPDDTVTGFVSKKELGSAYQLDQIQEGQVMLCLVTGKGSNGKVLKLCPDPNKFTVTSKEGKPPSLTQAPTVDAFLPGTAVEMLVVDSGPKGVAGKVMGMLDVTADIVHSGAAREDDMSKKYKVGSKVKARIIYAVPKDDGSRRVGASFLEHNLALTAPPTKLPVNATATLKAESASLAQELPLSSSVKAKVIRISADRGLFFTLAQDGRRGLEAQAFAHISQISDEHTETLSETGLYKPDTVHDARILAYNPVDNTYYVSMKRSVLDQTFLRLEDLPVGEVVKGTVDKLILGGPKGITGVVIKLSDNITGLVPEMHLSDAQLQHPERKFREGFPVKARVLSVDTEKRQARLTLKKSLVENDALVWKDYADLQPGMEGKGTIINLRSNGAVVQFYGHLRAWLPVAEMSNTYVENPEHHFRLGQTVNVRILSVDPDKDEMKVTCRDESVFEPEQQQAWKSIDGGDLVTATVSGKTADGISVDLDNGLKGTIKASHLTDGSASKAEKELKRIRVGQKLANLLVLDKLERSHTLVLTNKPGMVEDAKSERLIRAPSQAQQGKKVHGFVRNITPESIYVEFANGVVGLLPKTQVPSDMLAEPTFGLRKDQTIATWVASTDATTERFVLTMREQTAANPRPATKSADGEPVIDAVDSSVKSMADFELGKVVKARIDTIKSTQINVRLADNIQGRVDVSEAFDSWDEIANKGAPLQDFKQGDFIDLKLLGIHDARSHRFLPISHRQGKVPVFELSAKASRVKKGDESLLSLDTVKPGSSHLAFVNNHGDNCVWVNLSPAVRGRIALMNLSDDAGLLQDVENRFRVGCALRVKVKSVDVNSNRLDLTARLNESSEPTSLTALTPGMVLAARVTKSSERLVHVQISDSISGAVPLVELNDDYDQVNPAQYKKNDIVRVCVLAVDVPNKKAFFSLRPSKVLSSSLPVKDASVTDVGQVKPGDLIRGFVKQVADKGVFVSLGARVDALVRIADLSDQFVKDWKSMYEIDQLVTGRILSVDPAAKQIQISLKKSHVDGKYTPPWTISSLKPGMVVTGKVRKVEDFGAFVDIDNTHPKLSGLCHRSEVAARRVEDVRKLYSAGDVVKAKVLNVDTESRKISLGLKASYFNEGPEDEEESEEEDQEMDGVELDGEDESDAEGGVDLDDIATFESEDDAIDADDMDVDDEPPAKSTSGLKTSGFDWSGNALDSNVSGGGYESEPEAATTKKRKRNKPEIKEDLTGDLDKYGPRSVSDFERQLLGQPNNSGLWIQYMAFQLQLSETEKAREIAQRALKTIPIRETDEKANVWIAWLNLEVEYGDDDSVDDVFKEACQMQDSLEMHQKLASIYIDSGKHDKADAVFERIVGNKAFRASPDIWLNYASFLMDSRRAPDRARALLPKAMQSVPTNEHRLLTAKFAALEYRSKGGDAERGRTIFEGLVTEWPKWHSGWDMWADLERSQLSHAESEDAKYAAVERVRKLYQRMAEQKMKKRRAKYLFKKWLEFEEQEGGEKNAERVKTLATEYVEKMQKTGEDDDMEE